MIKKIYIEHLIAVFQTDIFCVSFTWSLILSSRCVARRHSTEHQTLDINGEAECYDLRCRGVWKVWNRKQKKTKPFTHLFECLDFHHLRRRMFAGERNVVPLFTFLITKDSHRPLRTAFHCVFTVLQSSFETWWHTVTNGWGSEGETGEWSGQPVLSRHLRTWCILHY